MTVYIAYWGEPSSLCGIVVAYLTKLDEMEGQNKKCKCGKSVGQGGIYCTGICQKWIHLRCFGLPYSSVRDMTDEQLEVWKCPNCVQNSTPGSLDDSIPEFSISIALELENTFHQENESLKQELHDLKNRKSAYVFELEDKVKYLEEEVKNLTKIYTVKETEVQEKLKSVDKMLSLEKKLTAEVILQAENDKEFYDFEKNKLKNYECTSCSIYKDELSKMLNSIKSLEAASEILQKENETLTNRIKSKDTINPPCFHCFPPNNSSTTCAVNTKNNDLSTNQARYTGEQIFTINKTKQKNSRNCSNSQIQVSTPNFVTPNPFGPLAVEDDSESTSKAMDKEVVRKKNKKKRKMFLCTDSHGRDLAWYINKKSSDLESYSFIQPGGRAQQILNEINLNEGKLEENSTMVIACGSNDVSRNEANTAIDIITKTINSMSGKPIILVDLPLRYDLPDWSCVNLEIKRTNNELLSISNNVSNVTLVRASQASRRLHTRHGMHLNQIGKIWLAQEICKAAESTKQPLPPGCDDSTEELELIQPLLAPSENLTVTASNHHP
ncbi:hypothetical protein J6590_035482 [Homalodisca vitripennis]|nr:hypothetical protein J6590_035482 [Homalodisca vitripennis]